MKIAIFAAVGLLSFASVAVSAEEPSLPFTVSISKTQWESPDYIGPRNPDLGMDYPFCPMLMDGEFWVFFKNGYRDDVHRYLGTNIENGKRQPDSTASFPVRAPYMLGGMWYNAAEKKLYAPMHCETPGYAGNIHRQIHLATSIDKGRTWHYEGAIVTRDNPQGALRTGPDSSGLSWDGGDGDFYTYVDQRGGYLYLYTNHYTFPKTDGRVASFLRHHVARCAISDKMAPGKWKKFYNGGWSEPGLGGKASWVDAYCVMYNTYLKQYISFNYDNSLSVCGDLSRQDWTPCIRIPGRAWGCDGLWGWWVTNADKTNIYVGDRTLYAYTFWMKAAGPRYRIDFGPGKTPVRDGYFVGGYGCTRSSLNPMTLYGYEPVFESADAIESRHTRRVPCTSPELSYSGAWTDEANDQYYEGAAERPEKRGKASATADSSVQFSFKAADIYWRAFRGPNCGKADVYLDGRRQRTVDCYAETATPYQFAFIKTGLDPQATHTIKVVVRGEKNSRSNGTAVKHIQFEYAAESYRASDGFSSVPGKNQWYNLQRQGAVDSDMLFKDPKWVGAGKCEVGYYHMTPDAQDAVRKWVAPHAGAVRIEGSVSLDHSGGAAVNVSILHNAAVAAWPAHLVTFGNPATHDLTVNVAPGDALYFIVNKKAGTASERTIWDPVVTYLPR